MKTLKLDHDGEGVLIKCGTAEIVIQPNPDANPERNPVEWKDFAPIWVSVPKSQMISGLDNPETREDYGFSSQRGITADLEGPIGFIVFNKKE